jgi:divalent metal cation (Fe/Co/Zn/Cd) transporter
MNNTDVQIAMRVSRNTILGNIALFAFKLVAGLKGHSVAMFSY